MSPRPRFPSDDKPRDRHPGRVALTLWVTPEVKARLAALARDVQATQADVVALGLDLVEWKRKAPPATGPRARRKG